MSTLDKTYAIDSTLLYLALKTRYQKPRRIYSKVAFARRVQEKKYGTT